MNFVLVFPKLCKYWDTKVSLHTASDMVVICQKYIDSRNSKKRIAFIQICLFRLWHCMLIFFKGNFHGPCLDFGYIFCHSECLGLLEDVVLFQEIRFVCFCLVRVIRQGGRSGWNQIGQKYKKFNFYLVQTGKDPVVFNLSINNMKMR